MSRMATQDCRYSTFWIRLSQQLLGATTLLGMHRNVLISSDGQYAYVADGASGLQILDVLDRQSQQLLVSLILLDQHIVVNLSVDGRYVFIADGDSGLQVIDVQDPAFPTPLAEYMTRPEQR